MELSSSIEDWLNSASYPKTTTSNPQNNTPKFTPQQYESKKTWNDKSSEANKEKINEVLKKNPDEKEQSKAELLKLTSTSALKATTQTKEKSGEDLKKTSIASANVSRNNSTTKPIFVTKEKSAEVLKTISDEKEHSKAELLTKEKSAEVLRKTSGEKVQPKPDLLKVNSTKVSRNSSTSNFASPKEEKSVESLRSISTDNLINAAEDSASNSELAEVSADKLASLHAVGNIKQSRSFHSESASPKRASVSSNEKDKDVSTARPRIKNISVDRSKRQSMLVKPNEPLVPLDTHFIQGTEVFDQLDELYFYSNPNSRAGSTEDVVIIIEDDDQFNEDNSNNKILQRKALRKQQESGIRESRAQGNRDFLELNRDAFVNNKGKGIPCNKGKGHLIQAPHERKKRGPQRPYFLMLMSFLQIGSVCLSMYLNHLNEGTVIELGNPDRGAEFNFMIGPSQGVLIQMGSRFTPCIKPLPQFPNSSLFECILGVKIPLTALSRPKLPNGAFTCTIEEICGLNGFTTGQADQWYRFFVPVFLHGGWVHLLMNMSMQYNTGFGLETSIGWWRMLLIYWCSGVGGFYFSGMFTGMTSSTGCSGALYGLMACVLLDLLQNWQVVFRPKFQLFKLSIQIIFSLLMGTLPGIDNFAHIGGFILGLLSGLVLMPTVSYGKVDKIRKLITFCLAIPGVIILMYVFVSGFYNPNSIDCPWCKYLNCIPGFPWCEQKWNTNI